MIRERCNPPELTTEQRRAYLEIAKAARRRQADLRAQMKAGEISPHDAIEDPDIRKMKVRQFLASFKGVGVRRADMFMRRYSIPENRRVQGLGPHQVEHLLEFLGKYEQE